MDEGNVRSTSGKPLCRCQSLKPQSPFVSLLSSFTRSDELHAHAHRHRHLPPPQRAPGGQCESGRMYGTPMCQWGGGRGQRQPDWGCRRAERPCAAGGSAGLSAMSGLNSAAHCTPAGYSHTGQWWKFSENIKLLIIMTITISPF